MHGMSSSFWNPLSLIMAIGALSALIANLFLEGDHMLHTLLFGISFGGVLGAGYTLQLGNWSKSSNDSPESWREPVNAAKPGRLRLKQIIDHCRARSEGWVHRAIEQPVPTVAARFRITKIPQLPRTKTVTAGRTLQRKGRCGASPCEGGIPQRADRRAPNEHA